MKINVHTVKPDQRAVMLICAASGLAVEDATEACAIRYRSVSAGLVELDSLVAQINDFWPTQPVPGTPVGPA